MHRGPVLLALAGGGTAWMLHLAAAYFLVSIGCARGWPALGSALATSTAACATAALVVAVIAWRARRRTGRGGAEASRFLLGVGVSLSVLFAVMIVLGGLTVVALPPCRT
jgi:hypothetical protein